MKQAILCYGSRRLPVPESMEPDSLAAQFIKDKPRGLCLEAEDSDGFVVRAESDGCGFHFVRPTILVSPSIDSDPDDNDADE